MAYSRPFQVLSPNGRPLLQAQTARLAYESGNNDVFTLPLGRAGHTPGSDTVVLTVKSAVPAEGPEYDWLGISRAKEEITLGYRVAGVVYLIRGDVRGVDFDTDTGASNAVSFNLHGTIVGTA